jgi:hypothetical protein
MAAATSEKSNFSSRSGFLHCPACGAWGARDGYEGFDSSSSGWICCCCWPCGEPEVSADMYLNALHEGQRKIIWRGKLILVWNSVISPQFVQFGGPIIAPV